jgi:hypothetical protein
MHERGPRAEYHRMCARLQDSWRLPSRDSAMPDLSTPPEEMMRRHLGARSDPSRAAAVENRLERERGRGAGPGEPPDPVTAVTTPARAAGTETEGLEAARQRIHSEFSERLQNAWKFRVGHLASPA